ncbi:MAG: hypothetical protein JKY33_00040, partial [Bacteroidia bacterium]|nr:hypothetical protein [Bacteroidia bacterium]
MDQLKEIVCSLKDEEVKQVKKFIKRKSAKKDRKDLLLLNILREDTNYTTAEIIERLYHGGKIDAYHQLRRNLNIHLEDYICQQNLDEDEVMVILKYILIANYFFSTKLIKEAWKYLLMAENKAIEGGHFNLLNHIYYIQIANTYRENSPEILEVIKKREKNFDRANHDALSNIVFNLLRYDLIRDDKNLIKYDIEHHIKKYLKEYNLYADAKTNT